MKILVVDDDHDSRNAMCNFLTLALGYDVTGCENSEEAFAKFIDGDFQAILSDIRMPGLTGLDLLKKIKTHDRGSECEVVLITGFADVNSAVTALREGAFDYLQKPIDATQLSAVMTQLEKHFETRQRQPQSFPTIAGTTLERDLKQHGPGNLRSRQVNLIKIPGYDTFGVSSAKMQRIVNLALSLHEDSSLPVLIQGETGTGKEAIAHLVHHGKGKNTSPFIPLNCSAIASGLFESELFGYEEGAFSGASRKGKKGKLEMAQEGTIFLDEIGDMPIDMQPKLLRVLQEREMFRVGGSKRVKLNVRIVAATNRDLEAMVKNGDFRSDLYYRLNVGKIELPCLREDRDMIAPLAQMFLENFAREKRKYFSSISSDAVAILKEYPWIGNIRELKNTIERVVLLHNDVTLKAEHIEFLPGVKAQESENKKVSANDFADIDLPRDSFNLRDFEKIIVEKAIKKFNGNKSKTAAYLGISRNTLQKRLENH